MHGCRGVGVSVDRNDRGVIEVGVGGGSGCGGGVVA